MSYNNALSYVYEVYTKVARYLQYIRPKKVLLDNSPHDLYSMCVYAYCKLSDIDVLFIKSGQHIDDFLTFVCTEISLKSYDRCFHISSENTVTDYLMDNYRNRIETGTPEYMYSNGTYSRDSRIKNILHQYIRLFKVKVFAYLYSFRWPYLWISNKKMSDFLKRIPRENLFYLPLHYQPEATTKPYANIYACQFIAFKRVLDNLREDDFLIVKEHPAMSVRGFMNLRRYRSSLFEKYAKHPQVKFAPIFYLNELLLEKIQNVISIAGTTLIEASDGDNIVTSLVPNRFDEHELISDLPLYQKDNQDLLMYQETKQENNEAYTKRFVRFSQPVEVLNFPSKYAPDKKERMWYVISHILSEISLDEVNEDNV